MPKNISKTGYVGVYKAYKSNTYYYSSSLFEETDKTDRRRIGGFKTPEAAYKAKLEYEDDIRKKIAAKDRKKKVSYLVSQYLANKKPTIKTSTYYSTKLSINKYLLKDYADKYFTDFASNHNLDVFRNKLANENITTEHKNRILTIIRNIYNYGCLINLVPSEVVNRVLVKTTKFVKSVKEKENNNKDNYWTIEQWQKFLSVIDKKDRWYLFFALLGQLGCRIGEFRGLQNKHVINNVTAIKIEQQASNKSGIGRTIITPPKTSSSYRIITMSDKISKMLDLFIKVNNSYNNPDNFLFFNTTEPIGIQTIRRKFDYYTKKAKLPRITIHGIRHSNCTWLLSKKLSPQEIGQVSERLGHASVKMTMDIYMGIHKKESPLILKILDDMV